MWASCLQSVTHYNRFGSTVPEGYEDERSATEDEQLGKTISMSEQKTTSEQSEPAEAASEPVSSI